MTLKILIVEDDLNLKPIWEHTLKRLFKNTQIDWSVSVEEAKKKIELSNDSRHYDIIISDIFLAGSETGVEFLGSDEVKNSKAHTYLISAIDNALVTQYFKEILPDTIFLTKPFDVKKCLQVIKSAVSKSQGIYSEL